MGVQHQHNDMGLCNGLQSLDDTGPLHDALDLGAPTQSSRVDEQKVTLIAPKRNKDAVARRAWLFACDNTLFAQEAVDERGFADVGTTYDRDADCVGAIVFRRWCL